MDEFKIIGAKRALTEKTKHPVSVSVYKASSTVQPQIVVSVMHEALAALGWKPGNRVVALEGTGKSLGVILIRPRKPSDGNAGYMLNTNNASGEKTRYFLRINTGKMETLGEFPIPFGPEPVVHQIFNDELKVTLPATFQRKKDLLTNG